MSDEPIEESPPEFGVACGHCGGLLLMATCNHFRGSAHEWVIMSACLLCRAVSWTDDGCLDCKAAEGASRG
jgi:hypothetical protein